MLISLLTFLSISNALSLRKDKSILFSRIVMVSLIQTSFLAFNPYSLWLAITIFSFAEVPPLIDLELFWFNEALSAALDNGYVFIGLVAILTSVTSAVYYLNAIENFFFIKPEYKINSSLENLNFNATWENLHNNKKSEINFNTENIVLSSTLSNVIARLTLIIILFIYIPNEWFSIANILTLIFYET